MSEGYTINELAEKFNITKRTIYYYTYMGLLPPAGKRGRTNKYSEEFVRKLEEVLKYRGKLKLSAIPFVTDVNFDNMTNLSVLTLHLESSHNDFLKYAHNAITEKIKKLSLQYSTLCPEDARESMIVTFPVTSSVFDEIKKEVDAVKSASRQYNGGVQFKTKLSEDNFVPALENAVNG